MAVGTPTVLGSPRTQGSGQTTTIASFTPSANSIVWVHFHGVDTSAPSIPTISDSLGTLTWTAVFAGNFNSTNRNWIGWAAIGGSPSAMTVTADWGASITASNGVAFETSSTDATTPVLAGSNISASGSSTTPASGTAPSITAGNVQFLFVSTRAASVAAEGGGAWTELYDHASGSAISAGYYCTSGDTTPTATTSSAPWRASSIEIAAAASGWGGMLSHQRFRLVQTD